MPVYLSILRGINVSGQKKIQMADLKKLYEELKLKNVITYIQSGNVLFEAANAKGLAKKIQEKIFEKYAFEVPVIIREGSELEAVVNINPFLKKANTQMDRLYVTFLEQEAQLDFIKKLDSSLYLPDEFKILGKEIYLHVPKDGYGNTKLSNNFFENKLKVTATTRNWKTTCELLRLMKSY